MLIFGIENNYYKKLLPLLEEYKTYGYSIRKI